VAALLSGRFAVNCRPGDLGRHDVGVLVQFEIFFQQFGHVVPAKLLRPLDQRAVTENLIGGLVISAARVSAGDADPLLIKVINDDPHRLHGALNFARVAAQAGHPVTVWITDRAARIDSKERAGNLGEQQHMFNELLKQRLGSSCALCA
jgi:hypothetical protein